ncbi:uncharacterized protein SPPG_00365 [Spizellomyces punctatus DAOM BR117]|uniref:Ubiquitin-like domain-containing protein n=1 Tax=Spizellomyces punctatus (strain DAOM BR117) TaxID=645134 RepID=A0A0L0HUV6_SPIPD|nr:uncharacterized protein SPPG_00365 [Spizellomyces punctatus DAOM BR117]KND04649.1 hypothetical protein SPPG_00365 [Spizellomyces punctatus DAOM BR117]|eukprot:XP_016612688.1 hypothetical protein SPPG_00365 [Spizellomyces punctatus DAOM BR117]
MFKLCHRLLRECLLPIFRPFCKTVEKSDSGPHQLAEDGTEAGRETGAEADQEATDIDTIVVITVEDASTSSIKSIKSTSSIKSTKSTSSVKSIKSTKSRAEVMIEMVHIHFQSDPKSKPILVKVRRDAKVRRLKEVLKNTTKSNTWPRIAFERTELEDHHTLSTYSLYHEARLTLLPDSAQFLSFFPPAKYLEPGWDRDYSKCGDNQIVGLRGGHCYVRPTGWLRFGLKVKGKYEDDMWLGAPGPRNESSEGEWIVTYHGTSYTNIASIVQKGYRASHDGWVWSTMDIAVTHSYSQKGFFVSGGRTWRVVLQNRVHPSCCQLNYNAVTVKPKDIRPYAILVQQVY